MRAEKGREASFRSALLSLYAFFVLVQRASAGRNSVEELRWASRRHSCRIAEGSV
ncbi:hypothetical protein HMPREF0262_02084 [Clostridium sp. ATCC 29733]|nr:hypothetical protein HMPREF0262_02084 [Clostridium sp. ATCC 29733]